MDQRVGLTTPQQREPGPLRAQGWKQACGKVGSVHCRGLEVCRCPWPDFEVEGVHMAWGSRQQYENNVPGAVQNNSRLLVCCLCHQFQRRYKVTCYSRPCNAKKYTSIDNLFSNRFHSRLSSIVEKEFQLVQKRPLDRLCATL